jgi:tRNA-splicing endonuclease subunit Sen15, fungi type
MPFTATLTKPPSPPSPLSTLITSSTSHLPHDSASLLALPLEVLHNLRYQHSWERLQLYYLSPPSNSLTLVPLPNLFSATSSSSSTHQPTVFPNDKNLRILISGVPPRHSYMHPDTQTSLLRRGLKETDVAVQREWVVPLALAEKLALGNLVDVFDALPARDVLSVEITEGDGERGEEKQRQNSDLTDLQNPKRVLLGMKSRDGMGGDGTVAYYVCLEGEVKPRQNG